MNKDDRLAMRFLLVAFTLPFLLTPLTSRAQTAVEGNVIGENGQPVPGANVRVEGTSNGAATTADGTYRIQGMGAGRIVVVASAVGYESDTTRVTLGEGEVQRVDFTLSSTTIQQGEVVVTGTMRETYVKDSPVKVDVVNAERLQQGRTSSNLMDLIGSVGGLSTQLNCGVCGTNAIRVNGVEGANTAVMIDGMPIMGALASVYGLNGISPSIIDQVEVIRGPQSTLYGTQALGGVVNIITKDPANTPTFTADVYGTSTREGSLDLGASLQKGRVKGFASANAVRMENYLDNNGDGFSDQAKRSRIAVFGKGTLTGVNGEKRLNVAGKVYAENRTGGPSDFTDDLRGSEDVYGESIYTHRAELLTEYRPPGVNERLRVSGALTYHDQDSYYGTEHYVATQKIAFGQATWSQFITESLHLLGGGTARFSVYDDNTPATSEPERRFVPGVFGQAEYTFADITLLGGLRFDHHEEHGVVTAPRLSAKYSPSALTTLRASAGTGFRVVNVFTEDHAALTGSRDVVFEEELDPEQSRSLTVNLEQVIPLSANPVTFSVDGFYTRFSNKIIPNYDRDPDLIVYENLDGFSVTRGFTVAMDQNFTVLPVSYNASFTLSDVFTEEGGEREALTYAPDFMGRLGVTYQIRSVGAQIEYTGALIGPKRMPDLYVEEYGRDRWSPTHGTHDLKLTKEFLGVNSPSGVGIDTYLSVENLLDYTQGTPLVGYEDPFGRRDGKVFDTIYTWGPIVGRTLSMGVRVTLR